MSTPAQSNLGGPSLPNAKAFAATAGSAAQPWIEQPTRAGWWWWERSDEPQYVEPLTNGRGEDLGLGVDMKGKGCTRCHDLPGWWAGPIGRPKPRHENTPQIDRLHRLAEGSRESQGEDSSQ